MIDLKAAQARERKQKLSPLNIKRKHYTIYALEGFTSSVKSIKIAEGVVIKRASLKERKAFFERAVNSRHHKTFEELEQTEYFLHHHCEWTHTTRDTFDEPGPVFLDRFKRMLRLFKNGNIDIQFYQRHTFFEDQHAYVGVGFVQIYSNFRFYWHDYEITRKDLRSFKNHCKKFLAFDFNKAKKLDIASKRFNFTYERNDWEDELIDLMIGFEALFSQEPGEISYRLSLRAAFFLAPQDKQIIRDFIKKCYDLRSKVVHGDLAKKEIAVGDIKLGEKGIIIELKELLKIAINRCLDEYTSDTIHNLIPDIDKAILE